jgi:regulator of replication initiation timing
MIKEKKAGIEKQVPLVNALSINTKLRTNFTSLCKKLSSSLPNWKVLSTKENAVAMWIESRDLSQNPYKCIIIKLYKDKIDVLYTVPTDEAPTIRRWFVVRTLINVLSIIEEDYVLSPSTAIQLLDGALSEIEALLKKDPGEMYVVLTRLKAEVAELRRRVKYLENEKKRLTQENYALSIKYEKLYRKMKEMTKLEGDALKAKLQEWINAHNGELDIFLFSKTFNVPVFLVEKALDEMVKEGYLEQIG